MLSVVVPIRTVSEMNRRDHWSARHRRSRQQQELTTLLLRTANVDPSLLKPPFVVRLTRVGPGSIKDSDNLAAGTKAVRDAVAAFLKVDDADLVSGSAVRWEVRQERGPVYELRIEIACSPPEARVS